jgi:flagellar hook protein FlgE
MSFEIARMAINSVSESLDVISNNIANASSYGYKSKRANFSAMYAGSTPNGAEVSSITETITTTGGVRNTGGAMDAMITDNGFFAVRDASGQTQYTRVGMFNVDKDGYVVDATGRKVQGYAAFRDASGQLVAGAALGPLGDLKIQTGQIGAVASNKLTYGGNLSSGWAVIAGSFNKDDPTTFNSSVTSAVYDSQGAKHTVTQYYVKTAPNTVEVRYAVDGVLRNTPTGDVTVDDTAWTVVSAEAGPAPANVTITPDVVAPGAVQTYTWVYAGGTAAPAGSATLLSFDANGKLESVNGAPNRPKPYPAPADWEKSTAALNVDLGTPVGAAPLTVALDYGTLTQYAGDSSTLRNFANGNAAGMFNGTSIAPDGSIVATYTNGDTQVVGTLAVATFANPNALTPGANTSWLASVDSGTPLYSTPGSATASALAVGVLEDSNVDLTGELVNLMSAQRNYQANTKVISAQSDMMQSLMQAI